MEKFESDLLVLSGLTVMTQVIWGGEKKKKQNSKAVFTPNAVRLHTKSIRRLRHTSSHWTSASSFVAQQCRASIAKKRSILSCNKAWSLRWNFSSDITRKAGRPIGVENIPLTCWRRMFGMRVHAKQSVGVNEAKNETKSKTGIWLQTTNAFSSALQQPRTQRAEAKDFRKQHIKRWCRV